MSNLDRFTRGFVMTGSTTLARRRLGLRLRHLREGAGKTIADVREATGVGSPAKMWRIETGKTSVRTGDVRDLCVLYNAPQEVIEPLVALARATKGEGWWEQYSDVVLSGAGLYFDLEADAATINTYDNELVHGLLQTPAYHRAFNVADPLNAGSDLDGLEDLRQARIRSALNRAAPCRFTAILGEAAMHRVVGSPEIMNEQRQRLVELDRRETVDLRVLPWTVGAHPAMRGGAFTIMEFLHDDDPNFVYAESQIDVRYHEDDAQVRTYRDLWAILLQLSVPLEEYTS